MALAMLKEKNSTHLLSGFSVLDTAILIHIIFPISYEGEIIILIL